MSCLYYEGWERSQPLFFEYQLFRIVIRRPDGLLMAIVSLTSATLKQAKRRADGMTLLLDPYTVRKLTAVLLVCDKSDSEQRYRLYNLAAGFDQIATFPGLAFESSLPPVSNQTQV